MKRAHQSILIASTFLVSWFGMQIVHESGHVLGAFVTGGKIQRVVLNPLTISRTDLGRNPKPLLVVWAGPILGVICPIGLWGTVAAVRIPGSFVFRFFAGFCLIANGAYLAVGSFQGIGDCGEMLNHGSQRWMLWLFGAITIPTGLWLWNGLGPEFGLGTANGNVNHRVTYLVLTACVLVISVGFFVGGK